MIKGFRDFVLRGNAVDLAVAVVIGAAFGAVVTALVDGIINPLIAALVGEPNLGQVGRFVVNGTEFSPGLVLDALVGFLLVAAAVYFLLIVPMNKLLALRKEGEVEEVTATPEDIALLQEIRDLLRDRPVP